MTAIHRIEAFPVAYRETNDDGSIRHALLARVEDADGAVGWGEAATIMREAAFATAVLLEGYAAALVGTPATPEDAAVAMRRHGWWFGGAGIASFARSVVDMALWDLRGRRVGAGLAALLGAPADAALPTVLTCHASIADLDELSAWIADRMRAHGAHGAKVAFGKAGASRLGVEVDRDVDFAHRLRHAIGPDARMMIDVAPRLEWTLDDALARLDGMRPAGLTWIEEPLGDRDDHGYRVLHDRADGVLIAYGEREWNVRGVEEILATGTVDVVGLDPGRIDGVSGFRVAAERCASRGVAANAHAFAGPLIHASSVALSLASSACHEFEVAPERNELWDIVGAPAIGAPGRIRAREGAGLGIEVDEGSVRAAAARTRRA
jgi:L-alanine-DL-glutamate epimerase-like enolase superfamily enzyme